MNSEKIAKYIWIGLSALLIFSCLYFYTSINIASRIGSKVSFIPSEIPTISEIFNSRVILHEGISMADEEKTFYFDKINLYSDKMRGFSKKESQFVKKASLDYVVAGNVNAVKELKNSENTVYVITLSNNNGAKYTEVIDMNETASIKAYLLTMSLTNPTRSEAKVTDIMKGDYLILEKSMNLDNNSSKVDISIELLRSTK